MAGVRSLALALAAAAAGCTVERGQDFQVADVVFDDGYFYCSVEPVLFASKCGSGDAAKGDQAGGCHFNVTSFRLTDYAAPRVSEGCKGEASPTGAIPREAQKNYQNAQIKMARDPALAPLLNRPTSPGAHPRVIFALESTEARTSQTNGSRNAMPMTTSTPFDSAFIARRLGDAMLMGAVISIDLRF